MLRLFRRIPIALSAITTIIISLGNAWISRTSNSTATVTDIAYGLGRFIAAGANIYSNNGISWGTLPAGTDKQPIGTLIAFGNGRFVSCKDTGANFSVDGINWVNATTYPNIDVVKSIRFLNGKFYICTAKQNSIYESEDGDIWTERTITTGQNVTFVDIAYKDNVWLILGNGGGFPPGRLVRSINNMSSWTISNSPDSYVGVGIVANDTNFFIALPDSNGKVYKSSNGISWSSLGQTNFPIYGISVCNNIIVMGGWSGYVYVCNNNTTFGRYAIGSAQRFKATYGNGLIVVGGSGGSIITSV